MVCYIGVSAVTTIDQTHFALLNIPKAPHHKLMIGVAQTYKSLRSMPLNPPWDLRTPAKEDIAAIFRNDHRLMNIVHYASGDPKEIYSDLAQIAELAGPNFHGFQLNVPLDLTSVGEELVQIARFAKNFPWAYIILNLYPPTLKSIEYNPNKLGKKILPYLDHVDAVLVDLSGGKGNTLDPSVALKLVETLYAIPRSPDYPTLAIGVAGGLGPGKLDLLKPFAKYFPTLSIDAEGNLRTDNRLDLQKLRDYLEEAYLLLD